MSDGANERRGQIANLIYFINYDSGRILKNGLNWSSPSQLTNSLVLFA